MTARHTHTKPLQIILAGGCVPIGTYVQLCDLCVAWLDLAVVLLGVGLLFLLHAYRPIWVYRGGV